MMTFLEAIAREEGFYAAGSRPNRNNNPGDIEFGRYATAHGATGSDGRFAKFPTPEAGFAAMATLFQQPGYLGLTVAQALNRWAPPVENQTNAYIANVCSWVGCKPNDLIATLIAVPASTTAAPAAPAVPAAASTVAVVSVETVRTVETIEVVTPVDVASGS